MGRQQRLKQQRRAQRQAQRDSEATIRQPEPARRAERSGYAVEALAALLVAALIVLIYSSSLHAPFMFDDQNNIVDNVHIRITSLGPSEVVSAGLDSRNPRRFVAHSSFALNYYFGKYDTFGYRLVNVLIHIVTGVLLYYLVKTTLTLPVLRDRHVRYREIAFFTALIWLVHPLAVQSVAYVVQRMNSLATLFFVLSLLLYVQARLALGWRKWVLFSGSAVSGFLALGSKENAAMLPLFIFLYEWYFLQDLSWPWLKRRALFVIGGLGVLAVGVTVVLGANPVSVILRSYGRYDFTLLERVLTELRVVIHYLSTIVFPHPSRLSLDKDFPLSYSLVDPITTLLSLLVIVGLFWLAWVTAKRDRLVSFCVLWFLGNLVIESSVYGLEIIYDHRTYLPSMGVLLLAVVLVYRYAKPRWVPVALLAVAVMVSSAWTYQRSHLWSDPVGVYRDVVEKYPTFPRGHGNLGNYLLWNGELDGATDHLTKAVQLDPSYPEAQYNLGVVFLQQGKLDEATDQFKKAIDLRPSYVDAHDNLGVILARQSLFEEALKSFTQAVRFGPNHANAQAHLGIALLQQKRPKEAVVHLKRALQLKPGHADAIRYYEQALRHAEQTAGGSAE